MARTASEALVERLIDWGVDTVFGLPGDGVNGIMEGLRQHQDKLKFVLAHHEEAAAFMAVAHAKATGKLGVCLATSGPGGIHLLNGLYDAKLGHVPVLAITGRQEASPLGRGYQQEAALDQPYADVASCDVLVSSPVELAADVDLAIRTAYARRGVAHVSVPSDIQVADADGDRWQREAPASPPRTAPLYPASPGLPSAQGLMAAVSALAADDAVLTCDSGTIAAWAARHWTIRDDRQFYVSGNPAMVAPGLPYAIGIQHAFPGRQVIAFVGDGGFAMLMAEFLTAVQHRLPIKVVISNSNAPGQVLWEQTLPGHPEHGVRCPEPFADYAAFATANGALGTKVTKPGDLRGAIQLAFNHPGPALLDVNVNPAEPPLPDKVNCEQAENFALGFLRGQPHRAPIATPLLEDRIQQPGS